MIISTWSNHDASFCVLGENGNILYHIELERWLREKEVKADALQYALDFCEEKNINFKYHTTCFPLSKTTQHQKSWERLNQKVFGKYIFGHHLAHAANAFYSSNLNEATIITFDGGGIEENNFASACSIYYGKENKIYNIKTFSLDEINLGGLYGRCTRYIHKLPAGGKLGSHQGSVMSIASFGDPGRFEKDFEMMLRKDLVVASHKPSNQPQDMLDASKEVRHPYLSKYRDLIEKEGWKTEADLAAGLQAVTEKQIFEIVEFALKNSPFKENLCLSGGVALNCVATGKLFDKFPQLKNIFIPPVCSDANLCLGAAQYLYFNELNNKRNNNRTSAYLGREYTSEENLEQIEKYNGRINKIYANDEDVVNLLNKGKIIAIFNGRAESGKRALGNRSILADPRKIEMKDIINQKIKNRKWYRPSAPSILREYVGEYFEKDIDSPYMSFAIKVKKEMENRIPAVVHIDKTARLQTVCENDNKWYYHFLKKWMAVSGVPVLLNTSFNESEPICENITHGIDCLLRTQIDFLYVPELKMLISKV